MDVSGVLEGAGLTPEGLAGPDARAPQAANDRVYEALTERARDPDFGLHFAERIDLDGFHVVGHLAVHSTTLGEALRRVAAHSRILHDSGRVEVETAGDEASVFPGCRGLPHDWPRQIAEFSAASVVVLGRRITGRAWTPRRVEFRHPRPPRASEHLRVFGVEPAFGQHETAVVLDRALLDLPVLGAAEGLATHLDVYAREVAARLPREDDLASRVHRSIAVELARGAPDIGAVAAQLGTTPRTLQRRLADQDTSFQALADVVRREFAERYLRDATLSLHEVGFLVGFSDPSNFHRAFRRWVGATPSEYRRAHCRASTTE